jgi:predicted dienelactone hydrolase
MCKHRAVAVVLLTLVCAAAVADARTPFNVGFRQFELNDTITGETYPVAVWFPTRAPAGSTTIGPFVLAATRNAEPADGRFGLILISHGSGGSELNHRDLGSALAKRGYIVAAPRHPRDNFKDHSGRGALEVWVGRPKQLSQVIDRILADEQLGPRVDASRIGTVGHSSGGYTALALAGAPPSMQALLRHCREVPDDSGFCAYGGESGREAARRGGHIPNVADPRVRAVVAMAPHGALFTDAALARIAVPTRIYGARLDEVTAVRFQAARIAKIMAGWADYVELPNAGHYAFIASFPESLRDQVGEAALDPPGFDRDAMHAALNPEIVAFFEQKLADNAAPSR